MNFIVWNVRGLNDPLKQKDIVGRIRSLKVQMVCLLETRVKENKSQSIIDRHFKGWKWIHNYREAYNGRIWILWKDYMKVNLVDVNAQCITCDVIMGTKQFYMSVVYGFNEGSTRRSLWRNLCGLKGSLSRKPWLLAGDYNIIARSEERRVGKEC